MKKTILAAVLGGVTLFIWGFLSWAVLDLHGGTMRGLSNEDEVRAFMKSNFPQSSVYIIPKTMDGSEATMKKYQEGPIATVIYQAEGQNPAMPSQMVIGLLTNILFAWLAAWFLSRSTAFAESYFSRVTFVGMLGIFTAFFQHITNWNWMAYPTDYSVVMIADNILAMFLAGLVIAVFVKPDTAS
ncbi:MAG: hypothetical protein KGZ58_00460 [Ignavibacteriales bacterium]|nr:hypothetical protein [Ignavibacteriales bacterium]